MPKLPTFTAQIGDAPTLGGRRASADDFAPGNPLGKTAQRVGEALLSGAEEEESRKALIASSEIRAKYARALDEAALSDTDTDKLKEQMQEELSKVGDDFQTTRGVQSLQLHQANTELMFDEQSNRVKITRAAATARLEGSKFLNSASELLRSNPDYLGTAEKDAAAFAATLQHISPEQRAEIEQGLKQELNMAAAISAARLDPEGAKKRLEAGEWSLTPQQREAAVGKADSEIRSKRAEESYQRAVQEHEERERDDKARDTHFADIIKGTATRRAIMDDPNLRPQTREHLVVFMEARAKEQLTTEKKSNPVVMRDLWLRIHAPDSDPKKVYNGDAIFEAVSKGHLSTTDANQLNLLVANQKDENNRSVGQRLALMSSTIGRAISADPVFTAQPALVAEIQNDYNARVLDKMTQLRKENKDPTIVFDPNSKEYVGSRSYIQASIDAAKQRQRDAMPKFPDLREAPEAWRDVQDGGTFIDPNGTPRVMNAALRAALLKQGAEAAPAGPSRTTPTAEEMRGAGFRGFR
jgi:hypothetical protein